MEERKIFDYYFFGTCVRYLQDARADTRIHNLDSGWFVLSNLREFFRFLEWSDLHVTNRAWSVSRIRKLYNKLKESDDEATLSVEDARELFESLTSAREVLEAELEGLYAYVVTPKRIEVAKLLSDVPFLFAPGTFERLPEIARYDLQEAGKCIAFERATAAAFHLMRATESVLRAFYGQHIQTTRQRPMWGNMVNDLRRESTFVNSRDYTTLLNNLDNIRLSFRNPTQHPDKVYDIQEVQDLWGLCVDAITRMARDLPLP